jgi:hypothetical protein
MHKLPTNTFIANKLWDNSTTFSLVSATATNEPAYQGWPTALKSGEIALYELHQDQKSSEMGLQATYCIKIRILHNF